MTIQPFGALRAFSKKAQPLQPFLSSPKALTSPSNPIRLDSIQFSGLQQPVLSPKFDEALVFASQTHAADVRKGTNIPYLSHLLGVASIALENGATETEAIAALLHDVVEDHGAQMRVEIQKRFGDEVLVIVNECSDADTTPKPPWRERKEAYIAHVSKASNSALLVSASDKLYNARSIVKDLREIGPDVFTRFKGGQEGTLWYYRSLVTEFQKTGKNPSLISELDQVVSEMEKLSLPKVAPSNSQSLRNNFINKLREVLPWLSKN